jgi:hypothetical protein
MMKYVDRLIPGFSSFTKFCVICECYIRRNVEEKTENESQQRDSNYNGVRIVNFATSKSLVVKSTMFPHREIHKYTWTSPDGKTHSQIDHLLIDRRRHSSILHVRSFRGADCHTDHYLVVAKLGKDCQ